MNKIVTKSDLREIVSDLGYQGYKGGYRVDSSEGWDEKVKTKRELVTFLYDKINENPKQEISIALYKYDPYAKGYYNLQDPCPIWNPVKED